MLKFLQNLLLILMLGLWLGGCGGGYPVALPSPEPLTAPVAIVFDITRGGNKLEQLIKIEEDLRTYEFIIHFMIRSYEDRKRVVKLAGDSGYLVGNKYVFDNPGVIVPIKLQLFSEGDAFKAPVIDGIFETKGHFGHVPYTEKEEPHDGYYMRSITGKYLKPGLYLLKLETIKDSPDLFGTPTRIDVWFDPRFKVRR